MTHEKLLDELKLCAEIFIRSSTDDGESVNENYHFTFEELIVFLMLFADGTIKQLDQHNKALEYAANWIIYQAEASGEARTKEFASNMAMSIRAAKVTET